jgi:ankyrin repeat protein
MDLEVAAQQGNLALVQSLLEKAKIETKDDDQRMALHRAAENGHAPVVQLLLEKGAEVDAQYKKIKTKGDDQKTALHRAAENGHAPVAQLLLEKGAEVDAKDKSGRTALHLAIMNGHEAVLDVMVRGRYTTARDLNRLRLLPRAAAKGHLPVVRQLVEIGVNPTTKHQKGWKGKSALIFAAENGHVAVVQFLLESPKLKGKHLSLNEAGYWAMENGHVAVLDLIAKREPDVETEGKYLPELAPAAATGHLPMLRHLLNNYELDIDKRDGATYETALYKATARGDEAMVRLLLEKGANVDITTDCGFTALHRASMDGNEAIVRQLLDKGADTNSEDIIGETPLEKANETGNKEIARLISERRADIPTESLKENEPVVQILLEDGTTVELDEKSKDQLLQKAAAEGRKAVEGILPGKPIYDFGDLISRTKDAVLKLLSDRGLDAESKNKAERTFVREAISKGSEATVETALEKDTDLAPEFATLNFEWIMYHAVAAGDDEVTRLVLERCFDVDWKPPYRVPQYTNSALQLASSNGNLGIVRLLVEHGANLHEDQCGGTALHIASKAGHVEIVRFLLEEGADINAARPWGGTVLSYAIESWNVPVIQLLLEKGADLSDWTVEKATARHGAAMDLMIKKFAKHKQREEKAGVEQNDLLPSSDDIAFSEARNRINPSVRANRTYHSALDPKRTLLNIRTGETEQCSYSTPYVIVSYVWHPQKLPDSPFDDLLRTRPLVRGRKAAVIFEDRLNRVCEAFPQVVTEVKAEDEDIDSIKLPIKTSCGLEKDYQHEVYLLAAREASRRGVGYIWMDSICIEQSNTSAVAASINSMASNYRDAVCCVTVSEALRRKLCFDPSCRDLGFEWLPGDDLLSWIVGYHPLRVWLFQETFLSKEVVSRGGNLRIEVSQFFTSYQEHILGGTRIALLCNDPEYAHFKETMTRFPTRISRTELGNRLSLNQCLELLNARMATIPQDRIFGALGLFPSDVEDAFPVDYRLSNAALYAILVYLQVFEGDLNGLLTLRSRGGPKHQISNAPSWIPTGQARIFQDGRGQPLEVGTTQSRVAWPQTLLLITRWMYVADVVPVEAAGSKFLADHNVLLSLEASDGDRLPESYQGAIEPLGYAPIEQENQCDKAENETYNAEISELQIGAREKRVVAALLNRKQETSSSSIPEIHVWLLLQTTNDGKDWRRHGLVRTNTDAVDRCNKTKRFRVI